MARSGGDSFSPSLTDGRGCLESTVADETDRLMSILVDGTDRLMTSLVDGTDRLKSTLVDGMDILRSNLVDETDSLRPSLVDEMDRLRSSLVEGMDILRSSLVDGTDVLRPPLPCGRNTFKTALESGHDYMFGNCCGLCERDTLQKEAVGFCVDCQDYLCTECFRNHTKPRPLRHHFLLSQQQMPGKTMDIDIIRSWRVYGCVVLPGDKLVVLANDEPVKLVKLIDLTNNSIVAQLEVPLMLSNNIFREMWINHNVGGITQVSSKQVAVIVGVTNTIRVVNVSVDQLKLYRQIKVNGKCVGIASINENLVVSYNDSPKVEIINMKGKVLQTVVTEASGGPCHVAVSDDQQTIYISGYKGVTSIDLSGQVLATYKCDEPFGRHARHGLTVDRAGTVYVCIGDYILQLNGRLIEIQKLPLLSDWSDPMSVHYCKATNRLYVGTGF